MADFTATVHQNEHLTDGGTDVHAIVSVTCVGAGSVATTSGTAGEIIIIDTSGSMEVEQMEAAKVLGVKEVGWKGVDQYPPILSKLIKISRFMVVQQAFDEVQPVDEFAELEDDGKNYGSEEEEEEGNGREVGWTDVGDVNDIENWLVVDGEDNVGAQDGDDDQGHRRQVAAAVLHHAQAGAVVGVRHGPEALD